MKGRFSALIALLLIASMVLTACGPAPAPAPAAAPPAAEQPAAEQPAQAPAPAAAPADASELPRNQTLYFNGQQWGPVVCWNPYSSSCNNAMAISQGDNARVTMFETPYLYNMLDGNQYPLLADGDWSWNEERTEVTFKLKPAAKWSDGTPVTAEDVAYTWLASVKYETNAAANFKDYIEAIEAVDPLTVVVKAKLDENGKPVNPLMVAAYLSRQYVLQKAWTQKLEERTGGDPAKFKEDTGSVVGFPGAKTITNEEVLELDVTLLIPAVLARRKSSLWAKSRIR